MKTDLKNTERGGILTEFSIVLPLILAIFTGFIDIGRVLDHRARVERVLYEGVRYGITIPGMESGVAVTGSIDPKNIKQVELHKRLNEILLKNNVTAETVITTNFVTTGTGADKTGVLTLTAKVNVPAELPGFKAYSINVSQSAAYLFRF